MQMFRDFGYMQRGTFNYKQNAHSKVAGSRCEQNLQGYGPRSHLKNEFLSSGGSATQKCFLVIGLTLLGEISSNTYRLRCRLHRITQGLTLCNVEVSSVIERL